MSKQIINIKGYAAMKAPKLILALFSLMLLAACGGSSSDSFSTGGAARLTVAPLQSSVEASAHECRPTVQVNVRFTQADGSPVADGTSISLSSSNSAIGTVGALSAGSGSGSATATTSGGTAQFRFFSGAQTGQVTLTASGNNPSGAGTVTGTGAMTVTESTCRRPTPAELSVIPLASSIESNPQGLAPNPRAPYTVQVNVSFRKGDGSVVANGTEVALASSSAALGVISPIGAPGQTGASASSPTSGGVASFWLTSGASTGTLTLTASALDPDDEGVTVTATATVEIVQPSDSFGARLEVVPLSSTVQANPEGFAPNPRAPYTVQVNVSFSRSNGQPVADGTSVRLASGSAAVGVVSPLANPAAAGGSAEATTVGGTASFWFTGAAQLGLVTLTASADNPEEDGLVTASATIEVVQPSDAFGARLEVVPLASTVEANPQGFTPRPGAPYTIQVNVEFLRSNGQPVSDGTTVRLASGSAAVGVVSTLADPELVGGSAEASTVAGTASFWFTSAAQLGLVTLTASADNPEEDGLVTASATIEVVAALDQSGRLEITGASTMPTNRAEVPIFLGSPYINELTIRYRGPDGGAGEVAGGAISVAVSPVSRGAFSTLDNPETEENEFFILIGSGPVALNAGVATVFVHSFARPGPLVVSVAAVDAESGERFSADFVIEIEDGAADFLPADISFRVAPDPVYVQGSGGPTTKSLTLSVVDSGGNPVPNPEADGVAYNNVRLQLEAPAGSGARLTGTGADGSVSGTDISVRTVNGIANFALNAGTETGSHRIIATVDRADNNVDNDFQDPLSAQTTINVGDGRLFALRLVSPVVNALLINAVAADFQTDVQPQIDPDTGVAIPPDPDGTYSYTVSVIATDRQGNPPLPGQPLKFGKVDAPLTPSNPPFFVFSGMDGDPEEGGLLFTAANPPEGFLNDPTRPDEAVEPGDTLVLFGKSVPGNREHEAARTVASVIDSQSLTVSEPFNPNNQTGQIVDDGAVIPWLVGRSQIGFVDGNLTLDARGRGSVRLTYPVNAIGQPLALWVQGERLESAGTKTVADAEPLVFPGVAPLILTASPASVPGNTSAAIRLCATDGLGSPLNGLFVRATSGGLSATLDGAPLPANTAAATGSAGPGCVDTSLTSTGMVPGGDAAIVVFSIGGASVDVEVVPPGTARLVVEPSLVTDNIAGPFTRQLNLRLFNGENQPISGVSLTGSCEAADGGTLALIVPPGVTDINGRTTASVLIAMAGCSSSLDDDTFPRVGQCEFTTDSGSPVGLFTAVGVDLRDFQGLISPAPPTALCPPLPEAPSGPTQVAVNVVDNRAPGSMPPAAVTSNPAGINCAADGSGSCVSTFTVSSVILEAPGGTTPNWSGDCSVSSSPRFASIDLDAAGNSAVCTVTFN